MFSQILVSAYGAVANDNRDDRNAVVAAFNAARAGDTIVFGSGKYEFTASLPLKSGVNVTSVAPLASFLDCNVTRDGNGYAFRASNVSDISFTNLKVRSNNGLFRIDNTSNLAFTRNDFVWGFNGAYYNRLAFTGSTHSKLRIEANYFHDSPDSDRNVSLFKMSDSSYSYNSFYNINDGGHILNPGDNVRVSFNHGRLIHRMGIEVQQTSYPPAVWPKNFVVEGNVFYDWNKPYWDSMGLSVPLAGIDVTIKNNYLRQNAYNGIWGEPDSSGHVRGSYGIEGPQGPEGQYGGLIEGNYIGSERSVMAIAAPGVDTVAQHNRLFGPFSWGTIGGEPGSRGWGNVIQYNNTHNPSLSRMPPPPSIDYPSKELTPVAVPLPAPMPAPVPSPAPAPPSSTPVPGASRFMQLTRYAWTSATNAAGPVEFNMSNGGSASGDGRMITLNGKTYDYGLGVAGDSALVYDLHGAFSRFTAVVGVDDDSGNRAALQFQVWADGRLVFDSGTVTGRDSARSIDIDVTGVQELKLLTLDFAVKGNRSVAHGDWAMPRLLVNEDSAPSEE